MALNQFGLERPCCDLQCTRFEDDFIRPLNATDPDDYIETEDVGSLPTKYWFDNNNQWEIIDVDSPNKKMRCVNRVDNPKQLTLNPKNIVGDFNKPWSTSEHGNYNGWISSRWKLEFTLQVHQAIPVVIFMNGAEFVLDFAADECLIIDKDFTEPSPFERFIRTCTYTLDIDTDYTVTVYGYGGPPDNYFPLSVFGDALRVCQLDIDSTPIFKWPPEYSFNGIDTSQSDENFTVGGFAIGVHGTFGGTTNARDIEFDDLVIKAGEWNDGFGQWQQSDERRQIKFPGCPEFIHPLYWPVDDHEPPDEIEFVIPVGCCDGQPGTLLVCDSSDWTPPFLCSDFEGTWLLTLQKDCLDCKPFLGEQVCLLCYSHTLDPPIPHPDSNAGEQCDFEKIILLMHGIWLKGSVSTLRIVFTNDSNGDVAGRGNMGWSFKNNDKWWDKLGCGFDNRAYPFDNPGCNPKDATVGNKPYIQLP